MDDFVVTEEETLVLQKLHEQVKKITKGKKVHLKLAKSIVTSCSSWNFPKIFKEYEPEKLVTICQSLIDKGLVQEFEDKDGLPSFVPISETNVFEYQFKKFTQEDLFW